MEYFYHWKNEIFFALVGNSNVAIGCKIYMKVMNTIDPLNKCEVLSCHMGHLNTNVYSDV